MCMTKAAWEQMLFSVDFHLDRQEKQRAACLAARNKTTTPVTSFPET